MDRGDDSVLENLDIVLNVNSDKSLTSFTTALDNFQIPLGITK
jgi:hypothetical protein